MSAENPCSDCKIRTMAQEGCCTEDVGFGRRAWRSPSGRRMLVCAKLRKDENGGLYCASYLTRPEECKSFNCNPEFSGDPDIGANIWG